MQGYCVAAICARCRRIRHIAHVLHVLLQSGFDPRQMFGLLHFCLTDVWGSGFRQNCPEDIRKQVVLVTLLPTTQVLT